LHDELGQSVTAIRSMALSVAQRSAGRDAGNEQAARLIADEAGRLYDAMHGIIPRLTPLVLDPFGLNEALADLAERSRRSHPELTLSVRSAVGDQPLAPDAALTLYRAAQEGITNALRHGGATAIELTVQRDDQGIDLSVTDNGCGLQGDHLVASDPGPDHGAVEGEEASPPRGATPEPDVGDERQHHGLRSLRERALALGGHLRLQPRSPADGSGTELRLWLPPLPLAATGSSASALDPAGPAHVPPAAPARPGDKASSDPTDSG
jgi:two-component system sensor histidine kinase UhpB